MTTTNTEPVDLAQMLTDEFGLVGFTIEGLPPDLSREQAISLLDGVQTQIAAHKAAQA